MKQTTYKKLLSISIASALGLTTMVDVHADAISTMTLQDIDADAAVSGFRFTTTFDTSFPTGVPGTFPGDLTFGGAADDCGGGAASCADLQFAVGEVNSNVFTSGFNFGGGGDFQPFISTDSVNGPGGGVGNATGAITIQENGVRQLDLTALDFGGLYNGTNFLLAPEDLADATGNSGDVGLPVFPSDGAFTGVSSSSLHYYIDTFTPTGGGNFDILIRWTSTISQGSSFDGQIARWRLEGTLAVTDEAPTVFISGAGGVGGNLTSNVNAGIDPYIDSGAVCQDVVDGAIAPLTDVPSLPGTLLPNTFLRTTDLVGTSTGVDGSQFTVTYTCTDSQSQTTTAVRTVDVGADTIAPVVTLGIGAPVSGRVDSAAGSIVDILVGIPYVDASASCTDNRDGNIPLGTSFTVTPDPAVVDTSVASAGNDISFSCNDVANNGPTVINRTVNVIADGIKPVITLDDPGPLNLAKGATFIVPMVAPAVTCEDTNELSSTPTDITAQINVNPTTVDTSVAGTTNITYTCADASGNAADPVI
ncbi:MAG: hypothetical protein V3U84_04745, partial [Thiotrichaceae bacterium]